MSQLLKTRTKFLLAIFAGVAYGFMDENFGMFILNVLCEMSDLFVSFKTSGRKNDDLLKFD